MKEPNNFVGPQCET